jgi:hypothetical protein
MSDTYAGKQFPIDTPSHARASWAELHNPHNLKVAGSSPERMAEFKAIEAKIKAALA